MKPNTNTDYTEFAKFLESCESGVPSVFRSTTDSVTLYNEEALQQRVTEARIDENRRSGDRWGGLVETEKLNQGMNYMNNREAELQASLNTEGGE